MIFFVFIFKKIEISINNKYIFEPQLIIFEYLYLQSYCSRNHAKK